MPFQNFFIPLHIVTTVHVRKAKKKQVANDIIRCFVYPTVKSLSSNAIFPHQLLVQHMDKAMLFKVQRPKLLYAPVRVYQCTYRISVLTSFSVQLETFTNEHSVVKSIIFEINNECLRSLFRLICGLSNLGLPLHQRGFLRWQF